MSTGCMEAKREATVDDICVVFNVPPYTDISSIVHTDKDVEDACV
jgi:hypothetical protein